MLVLFTRQLKFELGCIYLPLQTRKQCPMTTSFRSSSDIQDRSKLSLIAAMAANRVIGRSNDLPWHLPQDMKYFKSITLHKPVIMGRKTFDSILARLNGPLPLRHHYVISSSPNHGQYDHVTWAQNLVLAIDRARHDYPGSEVVIVGGASVYDQALRMQEPYKIDRMYLTILNQDVQGDACFPEFNEHEWQSNTVIECTEKEWSYKTKVFDRLQSL